MIFGYQTLLCGTQAFRTLLNVTEALQGLQSECVEIIFQSGSELEHII